MCGWHADRYHFQTTLLTLGSEKGLIFGGEGIIWHWNYGQTVADWAKFCTEIVSELSVDKTFDFLTCSKFTVVTNALEDGWYIRIIYGFWNEFSGTLCATICGLFLVFIYDVGCRCPSSILLLFVLLVFQLNSTSWWFICLNWNDLVLSFFFLSPTNAFSHHLQSSS